MSVMLLFSFIVMLLVIGTRAEVGQAGQTPLRVWVTTDSLRYHRGEPIHVTVRNQLSTLIYAPPDQTYCSIIGVQRLEAGQWGTEGGCAPAEGSAFFSVVAPEGEIGGILGPAAQDSGVQGPLIGEPSSPGVFEGDVRTLPPVKPWQPGDPVFEVPRGGVSAEGQVRPFSALGSELGPGTYRIVFSFRMGSTSGPVHTVYSEEFVVGD